MLRITLRDGEKAVVNGAVLRSVGKTQIVIENHVAILRGREVMRPEDATTPARQLYFAAMLAYIDEEGRAGHQDAVVALLADVLASVTAPGARETCVRFASEIAGGNHYRALAAARELIALEGAAAEPQAA
ncbi:MULTISPECIES: flagellar biosynthesis repressor FlbT [unclassified Sphingosinithalassobacter]|uniref:flagellar biosynthesis repressor FlbT n=1 Tax=unclassified Sphingosinithalassobacter TaxID=2676235 RepID=UPI00165E82F3|nr:flagellar biosynthesis repressor FlbT [Sphingosinithalassobacter sp. CS137]